MRSRNQRSWLITTRSQQVEERFLERRNVSTSRSLVGSSSNSRLQPVQQLGEMHAIALTPDKLPTFRCCVAPLKLNHET